MIPLFNQTEFNLAKSKDKLPCECKFCHKVFYSTKHYIQFALNPNHRFTRDFCSTTCQHKNQKTQILMHCQNCNKELLKYVRDIKESKSGYVFCSCSCAATYNNTHKTHGCRRSKLEIWLEEQLPKLYTDLEFHFNRKDAINSELDIYIPSLKLAFELNGIFHYEPIYGEKKLDQIQNNDQNKFKLCQDNNISLCIIDVSSFNHFKEHLAKKYLDIITNIVNNQLNYNS